MDLGLLCEDTAKQINALLNDILLAYGDQASRKWGVRNSGFCLLIAWLSELVQQKVGEDQKPPRHCYPPSPPSRN
jgi:hypothetical protein